MNLTLSDELGRRYVQRNALFYGRLQMDRGLESEPPMSRDTIEKRLKILANGGLTDYVPDPLKLPGSPVLNYNPNLSAYDGLTGGGANV